MQEVISVKFTDKGKTYYFDPKGNSVQIRDKVIVDTAKGIEYGECVHGNHMVEDSMVVKPLRAMVRPATPEDMARAAENREKELRAADYCERKIRESELPMKLVRVELSFDGSKMIFYFTSEGRVDFRDLVKDLAGAFKTRIELRQIGIRDEAKMLGGLGVCGKQFCCSQFLRDFHPVSIKMAKTQGLSLNPTKISGTCGRLMCCLKYEEHAYEDVVKRAPKPDAFVETPAGKGSVVGVNLLRGTVKVRLEDGADTTLKTFTFDELEVLGGKGKRAEYIAARNEGRLEEAGFKPSKPAPEAPAFRFSDSAAPPAASGVPGAPEPGGGRPPQRRNSGRRQGNRPARPPQKDTAVQPAGGDKAAASQPTADKAAAQPEKKKSNNRRRRGGRGKRGG